MTTLKRGSRGEEVKTLQRKLNLSVDGIFGVLTEEAVLDFQKSKGLVADGIVGAKTWAALGVVSAQATRSIDKIIVHCTATPEGMDVSAATVRGWHLARGFNDIGYHWLIRLDGRIEQGRDESKIGAHCTGQNAHSIGIAYAGGCAADGKTPKDTRTPAQKAALLLMLKELKGRYPNAKIYSHRDFANKACPSFDATKEYSGI